MCVSHSSFASLGELNGNKSGKEGSPSVTNLEFTLGLTENMDKNGVKVNKLFLPMSLRVEDSSVEKSADGEIVDYIFSKDASVAKYDTMLVKDDKKTIPTIVQSLLSDEFIKDY